MTFFDLPIHFTCLQIVQRSLSGGFLTQDAALLKANARSMFDETRYHVLGGPRPWRRAPRRRAALRSYEKPSSRPEAGCELWEVA